MTKPELRREMRARLAAQKGRAEKSSAIVQKIAVCPAFSMARTVASFDGSPVEPDVAFLCESAAAAEIARRFCYPRVVGDNLVFFEVLAPAELLAATWHAHIREPAYDETRLVDVNEIELILVPGLAFTRDGRRLGRGGGFYDRLLAQLSPDAVKIGVCFEVQIVSELPLEPHDQRVDAVVTETSEGGVPATP